MSNKFIDSIKHVIIQDDDPRSQGQGQAHPQLHSEASPPGAAPVAASTENASYHPASTPPMTEETEHVYQRILAKTNFDATQVAATIHKYLDPLSAIPSLPQRPPPSTEKSTIARKKCRKSLTRSPRSKRKLPSSNSACRTSPPNWWERKARFSAPNRSLQSQSSGAPLKSIRRRPSTSAF